MTTKTESETPQAPHVPAAFINCIADEGTKKEAVEWLQRIWNERCQLERELNKAKDALVIANTVAHNLHLEIDSLRTQLETITREYENAYRGYKEAIAQLEDKSKSPSDGEKG